MTNLTTPLLSDGNETATLPNTSGCETVGVPRPQKRIWMLEAVRGFAAVYVVLHHLWLRSSPAILHNVFVKAVLLHGEGAVVAFFLLSGFVIEHTTSLRRDKSFGDFFQRRLFRLYPLFIISLLVTYCVTHFFSVSLHHPAGWRDFFGNLLMLQNYDTLKGAWLIYPYGDNFPLWSLAFEWWFYMAYYPIRTYVPESRQAYCIGSLSILAILYNFVFTPSQPSLVLALFMIWWLGVESARSYARHGGQVSLADLKVPLSFVVAGGLVLAPLWKARVQQPDSAALFKLDFYAYAYSVLIIVAAYGWSRMGFRGFRLLLGPFAIFAPISYALYVLHYPLLILTPTLQNRTAEWLLLLLLSGVLIVLGYVFETLSNRLTKAASRMKQQRPRAAAVDSCVAESVT